MKVIAFTSIKGGVGKTTLTYNFGEWLADSGCNVLLIDADPQCNLSQTYDVYKNKNTIADIFDVGNSDFIPASTIIQHKHKNLDLISGNTNLNQIEMDMQTKFNKEMVMYMWMNKNYEQLNNYDYVLIDCHPDFSTITINMILAANAIYSPLELSESNFDSKELISTRFDLLKHELVNPISDTKGNNESYVTAKLYFIGNRLKQSTLSSEQFANKLDNDNQMLGFIPEKELLNKSVLFHQPISKLKTKKNNYQMNKKFFDDLYNTFDKMKKV